MNQAEELWAFICNLKASVSIIQAVKELTRNGLAWTVISKEEMNPGYMPQNKAQRERNEEPVKKENHTLISKVYQAAEVMMSPYMVQAMGEVPFKVFPLSWEHDGLLVASKGPLTDSQLDMLNSKGRELIKHYLGFEINLDLTPGWLED